MINANRLIEQLTSGKIAIPGDATKEALVSEMRAVRAFFYWMLCDNFGDVPLITDRSDVLLEKTGRKDIYLYCKRTHGMHSGPGEDRNTLMYGRFNKWAAKTLLANVYLNAGVYTGETKWEECLAQCNDIIASGKYKLETGLSAPFVTENQNSQEIVFAIPLKRTWQAGSARTCFRGTLRSKIKSICLRRHGVRVRRRAYLSLSTPTIRMTNA